MRQEGIGLWFAAKISNLWPQVGRQIKWKIVCFDFYLVGHVLREGWWFGGL